MARSVPKSYVVLWIAFGVMTVSLPILVTTWLLEPSSGDLVAMIGGALFWVLTLLSALRLRRRFRAMR